MMNVILIIMAHRNNTPPLNGANKNESSNVKNVIPFAMFNAINAINADKNQNKPPL